LKQSGHFAIGELNRILSFIRLYGKWNRDVVDLGIEKQSFSIRRPVWREIPAAGCDASFAAAEFMDIDVRLPQIEYGINHLPAAR